MSIQKVLKFSYKSINRHERDSITRKFMEHPHSIKYCSVCGAKIVYWKRLVYYDQATGEPIYNHIFACRKKVRLFGLNLHDSMTYSYFDGSTKIYSGMPSR